MTGKDDVRQQLADLRRRHFETLASCQPLPYLATDGKTYPRDYADAVTLYEITGHLKIDSVLRDKIIHAMALAFDAADKARIAKLEGRQVVVLGKTNKRVSSRARQWIRH